MPLAKPTKPIVATEITCGCMLFIGCEHDMLWTDESVKLLIETWKSYQMQFEKPRCKKSKLWRKIAEIMSADSPELQFTGSECDRKWRNLMQTFRKIRDKKKKTGHGSLYWKFYDVLQIATKDKASIEPNYNVLISSSQTESTDVQDRSLTEETQKESESACTPIKSATMVDAAVQTPTKASRKRKAQKSLAKDPPAWFINYMEQRRTDNDQRWQASQALEQEKIQVMKELIKALKPSD